VAPAPRTPRRHGGLDQRAGEALAARLRADEQVVEHPAASREDDLWQVEQDGKAERGGAGILGQQDLGGRMGGEQGCLRLRRRHGGAGQHGPHLGRVERQAVPVRRRQEVDAEGHAAASRTWKGRRPRSRTAPFR
jgi:hypothetical protein